MQGLQLKCLEQKNENSLNAQTLFSIEKVLFIFPHKELELRVLPAIMTFNDSVLRNEHVPPTSSKSPSFVFQI